MPAQEPLAVGVFDDLEKAERTMDALRRAGFPSDEIGIIGNVNNQKQSAVPTPADTKVPETNARNGLVGGAILGAIIGLVVIAVIPGIGWVSGGGRLFEIVGGVILGAAVGGPLFAFGSMLFTRAKARRYGRELEQGRYIVTVADPRRQEEAMSLLRRQAIHAEKNAG